VFIHLYQGNNTLSANFLDWSARIKLNGEQGLLGLAFHQDYANNGFFFVYYSKSGTGESVLSRLSRSAADPNTADPNSEVV
jgi:hypothetical protein